jgi:nucleoside-diphosphate-sugar epimerase
MRILVTGDKGLIGRAVASRLREAGDSVIGFDRADGHDIIDPAALSRAAEGCDSIVHAAALLGRKDDLPNDIMAVNVTGTWNALAAAKIVGAQRVVAFSSVNVLGIFSGNGTPDYLPIDDDHPVRATTAYGISKRLGEEMCRCFTLDTGIATICLRPPWVTDDTRKASELAKRAADPEAEWTPFWEYGAWIDVRDLAEAVHLALRCPDPGHMTALVIADDVASRTPSMDLAARLLPSTPWRGPPLAEPRAALVKSDVARLTFGWRPRHRWL